MTAWLGTEYFLAAVLALFVVDRLGRRRLMIWGALGMAVSLGIIGACLSQATDTYKAPAYAATVFIFVYDTFFALGWLGITWLYPAEVTPIRIRTEAAGISTVSNWFFNYAVSHPPSLPLPHSLSPFPSPLSPFTLPHPLTKTQVVQLAPIMINKISWKTYFVFFTFNLAFIPVIYFYFPETNGYKLETLDAIFAEAHEKGENPVWTEKRWRKAGGRSDGGGDEEEGVNGGEKDLKGEEEDLKMEVGGKEVS